VKADAYAAELQTQGAQIASEYPEVSCRWQGDELVFPKADDDGFEIRLQPDAAGVIVLTDVGLHVHVEGDPEDAVRDALGLVRDLLSPDMRVVERRSGQHGYRWTLERLESGRWLGEARTGLLFWNYFGRRSEQIYQNRRFPGRLADTAGFRQATPCRRRWRPGSVRRTEAAC
jgi:hypothetical protein